MATNTYVALATQTLSSSATSVTFSSISNGYTDLILVANTIVPTGNTFPECSLRFNSDTGSNYSSTYLLGLSSSAISGRASNITYADCGYLSANSGNPNTRIINIMNYSNTTTNKTVLVRGSSVNGNQVISYANLWRNTAAITSIDVFTQSGTYAAGSTFSLYGIAAEGAAYATGGMVTSDSQYYYHTFTSTGAFVPKQSLTCDVLAIAGGGGGGYQQAGGGGAGGLLAFTSQSVTATSYTVTVGAGGAGGTSFPTRGTNGLDSQFGALTLVKGGGGGGVGSTTAPNNAGRDGGSGGGGGNPDVGTGAAGSPTSGQGFAGGTGSSDNATYRNSGGGGGAGGAGVSATSAVTVGTGGAGTSAYSDWASATSTGVSGNYAGGGAGGGNTAGTATAGGGRGGDASAGANGTANTGGGGGGGGYSGNINGYNGGSGIVIVRYLKA